MDDLSAADDIVSGYLWTHPEWADKLDEETRKHVLELVKIGELFGQPAFA